MRAYVTWREFSRIVESKSNGGVRRSWAQANCFDADQLARLYEADQRRETIELIPSAEPPPQRLTL